MNKDLSNIKSILSLAGVWTPNGASDPVSHASIPVANGFYSEIMLANGRNGLVLDGWSYSGWDNKIFYPVSAAVFEQNADGTLTIATSKYLPDATTNGSGSTVVADLNSDGKQDIFFAAHNESPLVAKPSTAYLSNSNGTFDKVVLNDQVEAHDAAFGYLNGIPTILTTTYDGNPNAYYQYINGKFIVTTSTDGTSHKTEQGFSYPSALGSAIAVSDFNNDGVQDAVVGDIKYGPGFPYVVGKTGIAVYKFSDLVNNTGSPEAVITPYFNGKSEYANTPSMDGPGNQHTTRVWVDDFNHDGKTDILADGTLWSRQYSTQYSVFQMLQNTTPTNGVMSFVDKTDFLNTSYDLTTEDVDKSLQTIDIDHSGINSYLMAGGTAWPQHLNGHTDNTWQNNYILLNDGTGQLHTYMHDQFQTIADQLNSYLTQFQSGTVHITTDRQHRFIEYLTADNKINLEAEVLVDFKGLDGNWTNTHVFFSVPLQLDPTTDYTDNITVSDRNGSMIIRTWAGNDTFYDTNANSTATINGGLGVDKSVYSGNSSSYTITHNADGTTLVKSASLIDTLTNVERLQFSDKKIALDVTSTGNTGKALEFIGAVAYNLVSDKATIGEIQSYFDAGYSMAQICQIAVNVGLTSNLAGSNSNSDLAKLVLKNVIGTAPSAADIDALTAYMDGRVASMSQSDFLSTIATLAVNDAHINLVGLARTGVEYV